MPRDLTDQPVAVLARHRNVADDRVGTSRQVRGEAALGRLGDEHPGAAQLEHRAQDLAGVVVVLDDEHRRAVELHGRRLYTTRRSGGMGNFFPMTSVREEK